MQSFAEIITQTLRDDRKRVEPEQRLVGGRFGWAIHRFPIKNGISLQELWMRNIRDNNVLLKQLAGSK